MGSTRIRKGHQLRAGLAGKDVTRDSTARPKKAGRSRSLKTE